MTSEEERFHQVWYTEFLGIGYWFNENMIVTPIFRGNQLQEAEDIWVEHVMPFDDECFRMRFIEENGYYNFIMYREPLLPDRLNWGFYRSLEGSVNYTRFKNRFKNRCLFTFAILRHDGRPTMFKERKIITDVEFMEIEELVEHTHEWNAIQVQQKMREKEEK